MLYPIQEDLNNALHSGKLNVLGHELTSEEVSVSYASGGHASEGDHNETHSDSKVGFMFDVVTTYNSRMGF